MFEQLGNAVFLLAALAGLAFLARLNRVPGRPWRASVQGNALFVRELIGALLLTHIVLSSWIGRYAGWEWARLTIGVLKLSSLVVFFVLIFRPARPSRLARWVLRRRGRVGDSDSRKSPSEP